MKKLLFALIVLVVVDGSVLADKVTRGINGWMCEEMNSGGTTKEFYFFKEDTNGDREGLLVFVLVRSAATNRTAWYWGLTSDADTVDSLPMIFDTRTRLDVGDWKRFVLEADLLSLGVLGVQVDSIEDYLSGRFLEVQLLHETHETDDGHIAYGTPNERFSHRYDLGGLRETINMVE